MRKALIAAAALGACLSLSACLQNRVREGEGRPVLSTLGSATVVLRLAGPTPGGLTYVRVHPETGNTAGGGCFIFDHFQAWADPAKAPVRTYVFSVPAGVYAAYDEGRGPQPPAFRIRRGERVYLGDFTTRRVTREHYPGHTIEDTDLIFSRDEAFAKEKGLEPAALAASEPAARFLCVP